MRAAPSQARIALPAEVVDRAPFQPLGLGQLAAQAQHAPQVVQHGRRQIVQAHAIGRDRAPARSAASARWKSPSSQ